MASQNRVWAWVALGTAALLMSRSTIQRVPGMEVKTGVTLPPFVTDELIRIRAAVLDVWNEHGLTPVITSSYREGDSRMHGRGKAEDYRIRDIPVGLRYVLAADVSRHEALDMTYQVIVEDGKQRWYYRNGVYEGYRDDKPEADPHMHVEYDGGTT